MNNTNNINNNNNVNINNNLINGANGNNINNMNIDPNNLTITKPSLNNEEKEKQRKKQMEYNEILRQQVEERNKRKELEKQKEKEEEIRLEEKLKQQLIENQKRAELMKNKDPKANKYINNLESPDNFMANPMSTMPVPQLNFHPPHTQLNNLQPNYTTFPGFYGNNESNINKNILNNQNLVNNYENNYSMNSTNKQSTIGGSTGIVSNQNNIINNNNYPNNFFNITPSSRTNNNNLIQTQKNSIQYAQKKTPNQTMSAFSNLSKNNTNFNMNVNSPYQESTPQNQRPSSQQNLRVRQPNWRIEELYMNFVQEQLKIINEYEININQYQNLKKDNFDTIKDLMTIKNKSLEKIQNAHNKFKNSVGVYPMDNNFNNRVTNLMDMMLEKKINEIQRENKLENLANNFNRQRNSLKNNNNMINNNNKNNGGYNYINESNIQMNNNSNSNNYDINKNNDEYMQISESQINRNIMDCGYKSKYEELKLSMMNGNEASQELRTSMSLVGFSKFVTQNKLRDQKHIMNTNSNNGSNINNSDFDNLYCNVNNGQSNLYTTWNEDKFGNEEHNENTNKNINNNAVNNKTINNTNKGNNKNNNKEIKQET